MELEQVSVPSMVVKIGSDTVDVTAGQSFKIKTSPRGDEILDVEVPVGKAWQVNVHVKITETDV